MKTVLITGSTDGIGKLAAVKLAREGHQIYLHGRNPEKLATVNAEIQAKTGSARIKGFTADLSDLENVRKLARQIQQQLPKLDVLINNAGVFKTPVTRTESGIDVRYIVNYFAPYVLTDALLPLLNKGTAPRIINLSSAAQSPVSPDMLSGKKKPADREAYAQSKLALTMWSVDLASRLDHIAVTAVNPGSLLDTNMVREAYGTSWGPADKGADIICRLALSDDPEAVNGKYVDNDKGGLGKAHPDAYNREKIDRLLTLTRNLLKK